MQVRVICKSSHGHTTVGVISVRNISLLFHQVRISLYSLEACFGTARIAIKCYTGNILRGSVLLRLRSLACRVLSGLKWDLICSPSAETRGTPAPRASPHSARARIALNKVKLSNKGWLPAVMQ